MYKILFLIENALYSIYVSYHYCIKFSLLKSIETIVGYDILFFSKSLEILFHCALVTWGQLKAGSKFRASHKLYAHLMKCAGHTNTHFTHATTCSH